MGKVLIVKGADFSTNKVDTIDLTPYRNLINPATTEANKYITSNGTISNPSEQNAFWVSDFIPVDGQNISSPSACPWSQGIIASANVYNASKNKLRTLYGDGTTFHYTYQEGDSYIRLCLTSQRITDAYPTFFACYGDDKPYRPYIEE